MSSTDETTAPTQPAIEAAAVADPPSWHGPVRALQDADSKHDARITSLESGFARLEQKTDVQTIMLGEIKGAVFGAAKSVSENPWVRRLFVALVIGLTGALIAWLGKHGIRVEFAP